ncbi:TraU family protein [Escherichia coli]
MKRRLWLLMLFLFAGHVPAASADSACEGRFVNPITDICWSCIFPLSLGSIKVSQGKVPDTANPSMPIQICPAPPPLFRRIGLAIGYWEPMALTDVTRSPGCMVNLGFSLPAFGKTAQGTAKKDEKQVNGAFYHVHWYKYPLTGSLVFGPNGEITPLSARTTDRSIIRAMMEGGTAKIYHCNDSDKCLKVVADTPVTISRDNALKSQITKLLASIQNKAVSDTPLDDKEKGFISSTTIPVFKYLVDPQMLGVSNSMIYQLTDYIGYDILLQYIQELIQQARAMVATGNYDEAVIGHINDNMNDATRQIAAFQSQVQVQQDALLVVDRQMSYMRQQLSARMLSRYQNNYHFGGSTL